ncbi:hypothetical protein Tco_0035288, partial [Tanacetum coccineum]
DIPQCPMMHFHELEVVEKLLEVSIEDEEVSLVDGILEGALGALGDEIGSLGDRVFVSSWVKSTNNYLGRMMLIFGLLEALKIEALVEAMEVYGG